jgi:hypothetical protein
MRVVQILVLDHLLLNPGYIEWVSAGGHAATHLFARLAPSDQFLDRISVARAFTPYQHASLIERLADRVTDQTALVVCPALDRLYREDDCPEREAETFLLRAIARLAGIASTYEIPVLVTQATADTLSDPVVAAADERIDYERTRFGPRFSGTDFETLVYPVGYGQVQTTIAFWEQVLADRWSMYSWSAQTPALVENQLLKHRSISRDITSRSPVTFSH